MPLNYASVKGFKRMVARFVSRLSNYYYFTFRLHQKLSQRASNSKISWGGGGACPQTPQAGALRVLPYATFAWPTENCFLRACLGGTKCNMSLVCYISSLHCKKWGESHTPIEVYTIPLENYTSRCKEGVISMVYTITTGVNFTSKGVKNAGYKWKTLKDGYRTNKD